MMRSEIELCPQPAQSVVLPPLYAAGSSPIRLIFSGVAIDLLPACASGADPPRRLLRHFVAFLRQHVFGNAARVDRQPAVVQDAAQLADAFWRQLEPHQLQQLGVAVLLDDVDAL